MLKHSLLCHSGVKYISGETASRLGKQDVRFGGDSAVIHIQEHSRIKSLSEYSTILLFVKTIDSLINVVRQKADPCVQNEYKSLFSFKSRKSHDSEKLYFCWGLCM